MVVAYCKVLSQHLPGGIEENHKNEGLDSQSLSQDSKPQSPEYEAGVPTTYFVCIYVCVASFKLDVMSNIVDYFKI
jgi:hypothetical protein